MERITCRECGSHIKPASQREDRLAQNRGFCGAGCEQVYDKLHEMEYQAARHG